MCERLIAISIPEQNEFLVLSYEGLHQVVLTPTISVSTDEDHAEDYDIYDTELGVLSYHGRQHSMLGLHGGTSLEELPSGERLYLDPDLKLLSVIDGEGMELAVIGDFDHSEDWAYATFSKEGDHIVIATPNDLMLYRRVGSTG